jgi:hypothetical protein
MPAKSSMRFSKIRSLPQISLRKGLTGRWRSLRAAGPSFWNSLFSYYGETGELICKVVPIGGGIRQKQIPATAGKHSLRLTPRTLSAGPQARFVQDDNSWVEGVESGASFRMTVLGVEGVGIPGLLRLGSHAQRLGHAIIHALRSEKPGGSPGFSIGYFSVDRLIPRVSRRSRILSRRYKLLLERRARGPSRA